MRSAGPFAVVALSGGLALSFAACQRPASDVGAGAPMFADDHGLLSVPAMSPLRSHLVVATVGANGAGGGEDLPAAVEVDPARVANITAPLTGRVIALDVDLGQRVRRGQVLAVIRSGDFAGAKADDDKARDALDLATAALARAKGVRAAGGAADKDLEAARSAYNQAQAELTRARSRLDSLSVGSGRDLVLSAPQSGVVTTLAVAAGAQVTDPTAVLMTVTNIDRVFVTANAPEDEVGRVAVGAPVEIILAADPSHPLHARITQADPLLQPDTRRQKVRIAMSNPGGRLLPNMYASVRLAAASVAAGAVWAPQSALIMNNDQITVLVEVRPWVFQRRPVRIGDETETVARVIEGLSAGDRVVVKGGVLLDD